MVGGDTPAEFSDSLAEVLGTSNARFIIDKFREKYAAAQDRAGAPHQAAMSRVETGMGAHEVPPSPVATEVPQCRHGDRIERRGTSKKGPYHGWVCPEGQSSPDRCEPIWS